MGKAFYIGKEGYAVSKRRINAEDISEEIYKLEDALIQTRREIAQLQKTISQSLGSERARIFEAHFLALEDRVLIEDTISRIKNDRVSAEYAFYASIEKYIDVLSKLDDDYIKERVIDIKDVEKRVLQKLLGKKKLDLAKIKEKVVIIAHDLSPSETASLPKENIVGFITDIGGRTSHTAIIARSLGIPAIVGMQDATRKIKGGDFLVIDGTKGEVVVNPPKNIIDQYKIKGKARPKITVEAKWVKAKTKDGKDITVSANIELPEEIPLIHTYGAEGIGLYRTEYIFLGKHDLPNEEEQYKAYLNVAKVTKPHSVIIRTMDLGGDKFLSHPDVPREISPFLGWRAIRFCLAHPGIFKTQLRAILRASKTKNIKIMFPMISGIEELKQAKKILQECKNELRKEKKTFDENISVGTMIEVPSAALTSDTLAKESDFFSIGTNDLIQYALAVDRGNEKVAYLYEPAHPAVIRLIKHVIESAHHQNIWVGMCGEMAGDPFFTCLLLGLGLDEFSMPPPQIPRIKKLLQHIKYQEAKEITAKVLTLSTATDVEKYMKDALKKILKEKYHEIME